MVITGGYGSFSIASVYTTAGWSEDLPTLDEGRYRHGCGHYIDNNNKMVTYLSTN